MKRPSMLFLWLLLGAFLAACDSCDNGDVPVVSITLNKSQTTLVVGAKETLSATVLPSNATNTTLRWSSSDDTIATVDDNGQVTAHSPGSVSVRAVAADGGGASASCKVTVKGEGTVLVESIALNKSQTTLAVGARETLLATVLPGNATDKTLQWSSSNDSIATVDDKGQVTARSPGSARVSAVAADGGGASASCEVTVRGEGAVLVSSIALNKTSTTLVVGARETLSATVLPNNATNKTLQWSSSDDSIATVDDNGQVTARRAGSARVSAVAADGGGASASCEVTVRDEPDTCLERAFLDYFGKERLMVGAQADRVFFSAQANRGLMDVRYLYLANAVSASPDNTPCSSCDASCNPHHWWGCWNSPAGNYLNLFFNQAQEDGQIPMVSYYTFYHTMRDQMGMNNEGNLALVTQAQYLARYFNDWRFMLQRIGERKVIVHIEPDLWGYAQKNNPTSPSPRNIPAVVSQANPADCGTGFEDNFAGFSRCLIHMVRVYAPGAKVGLHASTWAVPDSDVNLNILPAGMSVVQHAEEVARYMKLLGSDETDFLVVEAIDRDADCYQTSSCHTQTNPARWWDDTNQTLPNFNQHFEWAGALRKAIGKPLVWWQLPLGNQNSPNHFPNSVSYQNIFNQNPPAYLNYGYRDNRVDYFLTHMDDFVAAGGVLAAFGAGERFQTNPLTDGGNFARLAREYQQSSAGYGYCRDTTLKPENVVVAPAPRVQPRSVAVTGISDPNHRRQFLERISDNVGWHPFIDGSTVNYWVPEFPNEALVTFELPRPLSRILFQWMNGTYNYNAPCGNGPCENAPSSYHIEVSSDGTLWTDANLGAETPNPITNNLWKARAHVIEGDNIRWIRFTNMSGRSANIYEMDIHDLGQCVPGVACDTWAFIGDSITADSFGRSLPEIMGEPFNALVHSSNPARYPSMINFGIGGNTTQLMLERLQQTIDNNPGIHFWAIGIGTNDSINNASEITTFRNNLRAILNTLLTNGKQPLLALMPYRRGPMWAGGPLWENVTPAKNAIIREILDEEAYRSKVLLGPNLYPYFEEDPEGRMRVEPPMPPATEPDLRIRTHPTYDQKGVGEINKLWAEVASAFRTR